jgi:(S)-2-hydroxyglutarate dehydrogenase
MDNHHYDVVIIGAGIVGLATAYRLLSRKPGIRLCVLEKEQEIAAHQSGHNSGVIHSGIYYAPGSLKAVNCIRGYHMLLDYCKRENIPFELCGKLIIATSEKELQALSKIYERGIANGLTGLRYLSQGEIREREPHATGIKAILVPQAGIINYSLVCRKLADNINDAGGQICTGVKVTGMKEEADAVHVHTTEKTIISKTVVNAAGLYADELARASFNDPGIRIIPFRGEYYTLRKERAYLVNHLIYPVPDPAFPFLGVHFTRMIGGGIEAGPNAVLAFAREGYKFSDIHFRELISTLSYSGFLKVAAKYWKTGLGEMYRSLSKKAFARALQKLVPDITHNDLEPGGAGVRAQACDRNGHLLDDFFFHRTSRTLHICNAPSPAATSSLSIGEHIAGEILEKYLE